MIVVYFKVVCNTVYIGLQWNHRKWTSPVTETSTMWTRVRGPELFCTIVYVLALEYVHKETSVLRTPPK